MSLRVLKAGLQTTIQGGARSGFRHFGMPWSGPADPLSMSLANRLVGNEPAAAALEITLMGASFEFETDAWIGLAGAACKPHLNGATIGQHQTLAVKKGDVLELPPVTGGCRVYLAIAGGFVADVFMGATSTYLPAGLGGHEGRALKEGDTLEFGCLVEIERTETPLKLRPYFNDSVMLQVSVGPDFDWLDQRSQNALFSQSYSVTQRASRMGCELSGDPLSLTKTDSKTSSAVFPGTIQCPPEGKPYILMADAQTTGGYPHILQVNRSDRFQLGQIRPGAKVRFVRRTPEEAAERLKARWAAYSDWLSSPVI